MLVGARELRVEKVVSEGAVSSYMVIVRSKFHERAVAGGIYVSHHLRIHTDLGMRR